MSINLSPIHTSNKHKGSETSAKAEVSTIPTNVDTGSDRNTGRATAKTSKSQSGKQYFLMAFTAIVLCLAALRSFVPGIALFSFLNKECNTTYYSAIEQQMIVNDSLLSLPRTLLFPTDSAGSRLQSPVRGVLSYADAFPDMNDVHLATAQQIGTEPIQDRNEAEHMKSSLVYVASSPYFYVRRLDSSIPYLVPHAYLVLEEIGRAFVDSLYSKGMPAYVPVVTSVLRTEADVAKLRRHNHNASPQSAHRYGTTFDISYNKYMPASTDTPKASEMKLKMILSEVLNDMRKRGMCYVKYEVHQSCFHITAR